MKVILEKKVELKYIRGNCCEYNTDRSRQVCEFQKESRISNLFMLYYRASSLQHDQSS